MLKNNKLKIALLQMPVVPGEVRENESFLLQKIGILRDVDLVCLPEMWTTDFPPHSALACAQATNETLKRLQIVAKKQRLAFIGSALEQGKRRERGKFFNSGFHVAGKRGGTAPFFYRKIHLFSPLNEHKNFAAGKQLGLFPTRAGDMGLAICYDLRFPEQFRALQKNGAQIIFVPSAWPLSRVDHFRKLLQVRAIENQVFVVGINRVGKSARGFDFGGHSMVVNPWGEIMLDMGPKKKGFGILEIDLTEVHNARTRLNVLADQRMDLYRKWL